MSVVEEKSLKTCSVLQNCKDSLEKKKPSLLLFLKKWSLNKQAVQCGWFGIPCCGVCGGLYCCYPFDLITG